MGFTVGDKVIYTGSAMHGKWRARRDQKTIGTVLQDSSPGVSTRVQFGDTRTPAYASTGNLASAWSPGDRVTGKAGMPDWPGEILTGVLLDSKNDHRESAGEKWLSIETESGRQRYITEDTASHVPGPDTKVTRELIPADVTVVKASGTWTRNYVHKTPSGWWTLSRFADRIDPHTQGSKPWNRVADAWFGSSWQNGVTFEIIARGSVTAPTKEEENPVSGFIGQRPATAGPKYQAPFKTDPEDDAKVLDANGHPVVYVDLEYDYDPGDDAEMSKVIVIALNEYVAKRS